MTVSSTVQDASVQATSAASVTAQAGQSLSALWPGYSNPNAVLLLAWMAAGPGALASVLQVFGQSGVPAAQAQVWSVRLPHKCMTCSSFVQGHSRDRCIVRHVGLALCFVSRLPGLELALQPLDGQLVLLLQVIFAAIPVWTALISHFVLGEEPLHALGLLGAAMIIAACISIALETAQHEPLSEAV